MKNKYDQDAVRVGRELVQLGERLIKTTHSPEGITALNQQVQKVAFNMKLLNILAQPIPGEPI